MQDNNTWDFTTQVRDGKVLFSQHHITKFRFNSSQPSKNGQKKGRFAVDTSRKLPFSWYLQQPGQRRALLMNTFWYNYIFHNLGIQKISRKFLAVSTSSFDGVKFFVLHLIHSVMVNLRCYRATYRHGVIPPPRQDSVQSRHLFQGQTGRGPASAVGMSLAKRDSWWRKKTADMLDEVVDEDECVYSCKYRNRIYISNYIYIRYTYKSSHVYPDFEPTWQTHDPQIAGCLDS